MAKNRRASILEALEAATAGTTGVLPVRPVEERDGKASKDVSSGGAPDEAGSVAGAEGKTRNAPAAAPARRRGRPRKAETSGSAERRPRGRPKREEGHRKTSTGYLTSAGQEIVRLTLHLTPEQKKNLKIQSLEAGFENASAYLIEKLAL